MKVLFNVTFHIVIGGIIFEKIYNWYLYPNQIVSREQIASFLNRSMNYYKTTYPTNTEQPSQEGASNTDSTEDMKTDVPPSQVQVPTTPVETKPAINVLSNKPFNQYENTKRYASGYSFSWFVEPVSNGLSLQGIKDGQVMAQYVRGGNQSIGDFKLGMSIDKLYEKFGAYMVHYIPYQNSEVYIEAVSNTQKLTAEDRNLTVHTFQVNDQIVRVWTDRLGATEVVAIFATKTSVYEEKNQMYTTYSSALEKDYNALTALIFNQIRTQYGLSALKDETSLYNSVARNHSQDMIDRQYFDHISPEGARPWRRIEAGGVKNFGLSVEVISAGQETPIHMMEALMQSAGHREAMLNTTITHYIIGYAFRPDNFAPYLTIDMYNYYK